MIISLFILVLSRYERPVKIRLLLLPILTKIKCNILTPNKLN